LWLRRTQYESQPQPRNTTNFRDISNKDTIREQTPTEQQLLDQLHKVISGVKAEAGENGEGAEGQGQGTGEGPDEGGTVGEPGTPEPGGLDSVGPLTEGTGGGNASPPPPVPDLPPDLPPKPGGARFVVRSDGTVTDSAEPAATRPYMRVDTRKAILDATEKTPEGDFVDPNTREVIPKEGPFDIGHRPGYEWWRTQQIAREEGWTREQLIEYENDPSHFQIEARGVNRGRTFELP
jgi:hypothetical protein